MLHFPQGSAFLADIKTAYSRKKSEKTGIASPTASRRP
jgi:hypothetical protein